ncbi:MAG: efflux RND transporter permease subunit [Kiritimatiellae bacterium]|nr:efflux RND transporter permease subunit [Kiritimatiellia bacterium]
MFSKIFIDRPRLAFVCSIVLMLAGAICVTKLPVEEYPDIAPPQIYVMCNYPGATSQTVLDTVGTAIEAEINGVDGLLYYSANAEDNGNFFAQVYFQPGTDTDVAMVNVQNAVKRAEPRLPEEVTRQGVRVNKQSSDILGVFAFMTDGSHMSAMELNNYVSKNVADALSRVDGVGSVTAMGDTYAMRIWLDPVRMDGLGVTVAEVNAAVASQNLQATAGSVGGERANPWVQYRISTMGRLQTPEQFENIVVRTDADGNVLRIRDIGRAELGAQATSFIGEFNGRSAVAMLVYRDTGANAVGTCARVKAELEKWRERLPEGVDYQMTYDPSQSVIVSLKETAFTLLLTLFLVILITYLFLQDWRATIVPAVAIPVSLLGAFPFVYALGFSLNTLTLFGLVLVIGSLVDDAIVVVENCQSLMQREGLGARAAAIKCMEQITGAIIATTLVTVACYVPLAFYGGMVGTIYVQFAVTMCVSLCISTFVAMTLSPALCSLVLRPPREKPARVFLPFNALVDGSRRFSNVFVGFLVRRSVFAVLILAAFVAGIWGISKVVPGSFLPDEDKGIVFCDVGLPEGASLERTMASVRAFRDKLRAVPEVDRTMAIAGFGMINGAGESSGLLLAGLDHWDNRTGKGQDAASLKNKLMGLGMMPLGDDPASLAAQTDARVICFTPPAIQGLGMTGGLSLYLANDGSLSAAELAAAANKLAIDIQALTGKDGRKLAAAANNSFVANTPKLYLDVDREKAISLGVNISTLFFTLQSQLASYYINDFNMMGEAFYVKMQADQSARDSEEAILALQVPTANGGTVPLSSIATLRHEMGSRVLQRYNKMNAARLTAQCAPGVPTKTLMDAIEGIPLPPGCSVEWTDMSFQEKQNQGQIVSLMALALLFAFLFLVAQYESWSIPVPVMLTVATATFGAMLGIWACSGSWALAHGFGSAGSLSIYAQLGLVMLIGLSAKNAILMVEFSKQEREAGRDIAEAARNGFNMRYRAVLMTAWSFIFGVIPLVFASGAGCNSRIAIGVTTCAGMLMATFVGILLTPGLYAFFQRLREGVKHLVHMKTSVEIAAERRAEANAAKNLVLVVVAAATALLASGCLTVRDARRAQADDAERTLAWAETPFAEAAAPIPVEDLVQWARTNVPAVVQARQDVVQAQIALRSIKASYVPVVDGSVAYTYASANVDPHDTSWDGDGAWDGKLTLNWLLFDFGRTPARTRQAVAALAAAEQNERSAEIDAIHAVRAAASEIFRDRELLDVARANTAAYREHLEHTQARFDVGATVNYEVSKARVDAENARLAEIAAANALETARASLALALGLAENPDIDLDASWSVPEFADDVPALMALAREHSPALAALRAAADAAKAYVDWTICDLYPKLSLTLTFDAKGDSSPLLWNYAAVPAAAQTLFAGRAKTRQIETAVAQLRAARSRLAAAEQSLYNRLLSATLSANRARESLEVARAAAEAAQDYFDIVSSRYDVGKASALERTDAQVALSRARAEVVAARYNLLDTHLLLARLLGTDLRPPPAPPAEP